MCMISDATSEETLRTAGVERARAWRPAFPATLTSYVVLTART